jgi:hypothetical protein
MTSRSSGVCSMILFRHPMVFVHAFGKFLRTRRIDYIVETLNAEYWRMKKYEGIG